MPDELMRFKYGESLFMKSRMHPIKAVSLPYNKYGFDIQVTEVPTKHQSYEVDVFNLDEYRKRKLEKEIEKLTEIE